MEGRSAAAAFCCMPSLPEMPRPDPTTRARPDQTSAPAVLQIVPRLVSGAVERGTVDVAQALVAAGWRSFVASAGGPMAAPIVPAGGAPIEAPPPPENPWRGGGKS